MKSKTIILIIIVGLIIGGISYWFQPYNHPTTIFGINIYFIWSIGTFLGALFLMIIFKKMPVQISLFLTLGVVIAVLLRIIYDTTFWDSTSHNLAGIEIIICGLITAPCAFAGSFLVSIFILFVKHKFKQAFVTLTIGLAVVLMIVIPAILIRQKPNFYKQIEDKTLDTTQVIQLYKKAIKKGDIKALSIIAVHPNLPDSIQKKLSDSEIMDVRRSIAWDTKSQKILKKLSGDKNWKVRQAVAMNKLTPKEIMDKLQIDANENVRNTVNSMIQQRK